MGEEFDVLNEDGSKTGRTKARNDVHRDGDWHRAVHVWLFILNTSEVLIQKRADCKESWPGLWDISAAGHVEAGQDSISTAHRETLEELGISFPVQALQFLFTVKASSLINDGKFKDNEFDDVYLVTVKERIPLDCLTLQPDEVSEARYIDFEELEQKFVRGDADMAMSFQGERDGYGRLFDVMRSRLNSITELETAAWQAFVHVREGHQPTQVHALACDARRGD